MIREPDTKCGTWQEFRDQAHVDAWKAEHLEVTGHDLDADEEDQPCPGT